MKVDHSAISEIPVMVQGGQSCMNYCCNLVSLYEQRQPRPVSQVRKSSQKGLKYMHPVEI